MFDKVFASFSHFSRKNSHKKIKCISIDTHNLEVDMCCDLWRKKHTSIGTLEIKMTCITRQLKYYNMELKY